MASSDVEVELKHLSFVKILALNAVVLVSNLYDYAKLNAGPFKSTVGKVEHAVTAVLGPVYGKFKQVPGDVLVYIDNKVDEASNVFDKHAPPAAKGVVSMIKKASNLVQDLAKEAKAEGPVAAVSHAAKISKEFTMSQLVTAAKISKEFTMSQLVTVWYKVNQNSSVHRVMEKAIPTVTHVLENYNGLVKDLTAKGWCSLFRYVPLVPVEEMEKAYKKVEAAANKKAVEDTSVDKEDTSSSSENGSESDKE